MRILHTVSTYLPSRNGMSEVVRQISERLVSKGEYVVVATKKNDNRDSNLINGVRIEEFDISGNITYGIKGEYDRYIQFLLESKFDIVTNFAAQQWATDLALPVLKQIHGKKILVPTGYSGLYLPPFASYYDRMREWLKLYDRVVYLSDNYRDINFARSLGLTNGILIPNGASEEEFGENLENDIRERLGIGERDLLILHTSGTAVRKGHLEAINIFRRSRLENAVLLCISPVFDEGFSVDNFRPLNFVKRFLKRKINPRGFMELDQLKFINFLVTKGAVRKQILFKSLPRKDVVKAFQSADLFLFPSKIECSPIVLFECLASKTPFLATDVGNAREIVDWSGGGVILPTTIGSAGIGESIVDIEKSARILNSLAADEDYRKKMADSGYQSWKEHFTWGKIADRYRELYLQTLHAFPHEM